MKKFLQSTLTAYLNETATNCKRLIGKWRIAGQSSKLGFSAHKDGLQS